MKHEAIAKMPSTVSQSDLIFCDMLNTCIIIIIPAAFMKDCY